jgi:hypothetical protein
MRRFRAGLMLSSLVTVVLGFAGSTAPVMAADSSSVISTCGLGGSVKHVIYIQFDNLHLRRDAANVPSDLEQMPHLLNFIEQNGVMMNRHYTPLIAHTANDIITSLSGLYGDRQGIPEANSYGYYNRTGSTSFSSSFTYWTDRIGNGTYNMLYNNGQNTPAPWVPLTRAGCNFGSVAMGNTELENASPDVANVYGPNSPQALETGEQQYADFVGIGVHCARGSRLCAANGVPDVLPSQPTYSGYKALFGHKYVAPAVGGSGPGGTVLTDLNGKPIADTFTGTPIPGFPGYDGMTAPVSLAYTLDMQTHGVPVTQTYISAAHVDPATGSDAGPGSAGYEGRLKDYDNAFGTFFSDLATNGITPRNTLFAITADENDQFAGGAGIPAGCDGVHVSCTYNQVGEVSVNLSPLMQQAGETSPFSIHFDSAPFVYLNGRPAPSGTAVRDFERRMAGLVVHNPIDNRDEKLINYMADPVEMKLLHMITADPTRTPSFVAFGKPFYYISTGYADCQQGQTNPAPVIECAPSFGEDAWIHGTFDNQINQSWLGMAGPAVRPLGLDDQVWSDHADILPTMLSLTGLEAGYPTQGRVLFEIIDDSALPENVRDQESLLTRLAQAYKEINAPLGELGVASLRYSTAGIVSTGSGDESTYQRTESNLARITSQRDDLAVQIATELDAATFARKRVDRDAAEAQIAAANHLIDRIHDLAT